MCFLYFPTDSVSSIIDFDGQNGTNMVSLPCDGSGWWQVDLGGVYNLSSVMVFNVRSYVTRLALSCFIIFTFICACSRVISTLQ